MNHTKNLRAVFGGLSLLILFLGVTPPARAIEGGTAELDTKFSWGVIVNFPLGRRCQGVLIAPLYVLTAAQCVDGSQWNTGTVAYSRWDGVRERGGEARIQWFVEHPDYQKGNPEHDIAVVKLWDAVTSYSLLQPAQLPTMPAAANQTGTVAISTGRLPNTLLGILRGAVRLAGGTSFVAVSPNASLCGNEDVGGGFMTLKQGLNVVTGIVSRVQPLDSCSVGQIFEAVDVFQHLDWILSQTSGALPPPNTIPADVVNADYDGDGKVDLAVKTALGDWKIDFASNGFGFWDVIYSGYGFADAHAVPADYDGDGKADLSVWTDSGAWYIDFAANGFGHWDVVYYGYGGAEPNPVPVGYAHPVPADYDGDGKADLSVKTDGGVWYIDYAANGFGHADVVYRGYGGADAHPVPADYDGDGKADLSVKTDGGVWYIDYARDGFGSWNASYGGYGGANAYPVPADYDGDTKADLSIKSGAWYIDYAGNGFGAWNAIYQGWGDSTFPPVPGDYDGDRRADLAVYNGLNNSYHIDFAADGFGVVNLTVLEAP